MSIHLFKHNQEAYNSVTAMLEREKMAAVIHPTGTGKSLIAFKLAEEHPSEKFLWQIGTLLISFWYIQGSFYPFFKKSSR